MYIEFMTKVLLPFILIFICTSTHAKKLNSSVIYTVGERETKVDWNIAGNLAGSNPNIISELEWKNLKSHQFLVGGVLHDGDFFLELFGEYGHIFKGENRDSDYNQDDRLGEYSRSISDSGKGYLIDAEINYGRDYNFLERIKLTPSIGYGYHRQHLKIYDGTMVIGSADLTGLNSLYQANWRGPQLGIGLKYLHNKNILSLDYKLQDVNFYGYTDWNLRTDLRHPKSMTQNGNGKGTQLSVSFERALSNLSSLSLLGNYFQYSADGTHTFHLTSSNAVQKLNQANWESSEVRLVYRTLF